MSPVLWLYQAAGIAGALIGSPYLVWRSLRHPREMRERFGGSIRPVAPVDGTAGPGAGVRRPLWIHAASLGEMEAAAALLEDPRFAFEPPLLVTVLSVSARDRAQKRFPSARVAFAPLDLAWVPGRFLDRERPRGLLLLETEIWPWTLEACRRRGIPVALLSGRLSPRRWRRTRRLRFLLAPAVATMSAIAAQSDADAGRFRELAGDPVYVTGNLKYRYQSITSQSVSEPIEGRSSGGLVLFVAGSVRIGEESVLEAMAGDSSARPADVRLVLVPRHLRERGHWVRALRERGIGFALRSGPASSGTLAVPPSSDLRHPEVRRRFRAAVARALGDVPVLLVDTHGELGAWYAAADIAYVGGTLAPIGGHNLFEPAREGVPVAFGPHIGGVAEVAAPLLERGGGTCVQDGRELAEWVSTLARDPGARVRAGRAALDAAREVAGAAERTWKILADLPWAGVRERTGGDGTQEPGMRPERPARMDEAD